MELWDIIPCTNNLQLINGCDPYANNIIWMSTGITQKGYHLLKYLLNTKINILNEVKKPTFIVINRQKVIALTMRCLCQNTDVYDFR